MRGESIYEKVFQQRVKRSIYTNLTEKEDSPRILDTEEYVWVDIPEVFEDEL